MAIDGVRLEIPDTPANAAAFGRPRTRRNGQSIEGGYPQIHAIFLTETGTHIVVEAFVKRGKRSEFKVATALLRKAPSGCLVLSAKGGGVLRIPTPGGGHPTRRASARLCGQACRLRAHRNSE